MSDPHIYPEAPNGPLTLPAAVGAPTPTFTAFEQLAAPDPTDPLLTTTMFIRVAMSDAAAAPGLFLKADTGDTVQLENFPKPILRLAGSDLSAHVGDAFVSPEAGNLFRITVAFRDVREPHAWQLGIVNNDTVSPSKFTWVVSGSLEKTLQPWIDVTPSALSWDIPSENGKAKSVTISNRGAGAFQVTGTDPPPPTGFTLGAMPALILPNKSVPVTVTFSAPGASLPSGVITVSTTVVTNPADGAAGGNAGHNDRIELGLHIAPSTVLPDEILINTTTSGDQQSPALAAIRGGRLVAVWSDGGSHNIKGQIFGANGSRIGSEFFVNKPVEQGFSLQLPASVDFSGGFAVAWVEVAPPPGHNAKSHLKLRIFDVDTLSGPESEVGSSEVEQLMAPVMARLTDGGFVLVWADKRADERIRVQQFGADGTKNGSEFRANSVAGLHRDLMVACLTNGNVVVGWRARLPGPLLVHFRIFDAKGPLGDEHTTDLDITDASMIALESGRFVVAHIRRALDGEGGFDTATPHASVFEADGSHRQFSATDEVRVQSFWPTLAPLRDGRFLLAWTQSRTDDPSAEIDVKARIFSPTDGRVGQVFQLNTSSGNQRFSLCAATLVVPGGEIAFAAWTDDSQSASNASGRAVRGRVLLIPPKGF